MGANAEHIKITATSDKQFHKKYAAYCEEQCYQYGNDSYAGHLGIKSGRPQDISYKFKGKSLRGKAYYEACELIDENSDKWDAPAYIKVGRQYVVGGWCAS